MTSGGTVGGWIVGFVLMFLPIPAEPRPVLGILSLVEDVVESMSTSAVPSVSQFISNARVVKSPPTSNL